MVSCFCGLDAVGSCQGPCDRRICAQHAVPENALRGYRPPLREFERENWNRWLPTVAQYAYAAGSGARCPDCRNTAAVTALDAIHLPDRWPDDPIELRIWQFEHFGLFEPLTGGLWGRSWAAAARRRGIPPDSCVEGRPLWQFWITDPGTELNGGSSYVLTALDEGGESPVPLLAAVSRTFGRRRVENRIEWHVGPVDRQLKPVAFSEDFLWRLSDLTPYNKPRMRRHEDDMSFLGVPPERVWSWMTAG